jgi:uncharacterized protein (TIGR03435 family)
MRRMSAMCALVFGSFAGVVAQSPATEAPQAFEVASVKPNNSGAPNTNFGLAGGRFTATNAPLREIVRMSYEVPDQLIVNAPEWMRNERFDVTATMTGANVPLKAVFAMVRMLLADRFKLASHQEKREVMVYGSKMANAIGTLGPRLHPSSTDCDAIMAAVRSGAPPPQSNRVLCGNRWRGGHVEVGGMTMDAIVQMLWPIVSGVVGNQTRLEGRFDFELDYEPDVSSAAVGDAVAAAALPNPNAPSIFTAIQEQLRLKLDSGREPRDVLVIDQVERPTPD